MPKVKVGDINIYYEIHGKGEPLVIMGGGGANIASLSRLIQVFSPEYQVIVFECRGTGRSDAPDIPYTMEMFGDDLAGLLDAVDIKSAHVYGESAGSMIAQYFAIGYPGKVKNLILASSSCGFTHGILSEDHKKIIAGMLKMAPEERAGLVIRMFITRGYADKNPEFIRRMKESLLKQTSFYPGEIRGMQAVWSADTYERLPQIKAPTLIIHGSADNAFPVENARILASRIPNAELVILKGASHLLIEAGEEPNRIVLDFLRRHRTKNA
jgi:pimeloyl-ACP methyl ester carboxylesterase